MITNVVKIFIFPNLTAGSFQGEIMCFLDWYRLYEYFKKDNFSEIGRINCIAILLCDTCNYKPESILRSFCIIKWLLRAHQNQSLCKRIHIQPCAALWGYSETSFSLAEEHEPRVDKRFLIINCIPRNPTMIWPNRNTTLYWQENGAICHWSSCSSAWNHNLTTKTISSKGGTLREVYWATEWWLPTSKVSWIWAHSNRNW